MALRRIEKLGVVSLASSVWHLAVFMVNPTLAEDKPVPGLGTFLFLEGGLPTVVLALLALFSYFVSGLLIAANYLRAERVMEKLSRKSPEICKALKTFPSIVTLPPFLRVLAFATLAILGMVSIGLVYQIGIESYMVVLFGVFMIGGPYIILVVMALYYADSKKGQFK